ncbi:MAG: hypothetical protein QM726_09445 [Chitinophagaceae bacterium]
MSAAVIGKHIYVFGGAGPKIPPMPDGPRDSSRKQQPPPPPPGPPPGDGKPAAPSPLEIFTLQ